MEIQSRDSSFSPSKSKPSVKVSFVSDISTSSRSAEPFDVRSALTLDDEFSALSPTASMTSSVFTSQTNMSTTSVAKTITNLLSLPASRKCADCRVHLVDTSQTFASFSPTLGKLLPEPSTRQAGIGEFKYHHHAFAPAETGKSVNHGRIDPAVHVTQLLGGHGVFICKACAQAHKYLGGTVTTVKSVKDLSAFSLEEVRFLQSCGGNKASWAVYEGFVPDPWKKRRPSSNSSLKNRLVFSLAKYDALAFLTPFRGVRAEQAWKSLVENDSTLQKYRASLMSLSKLTLSETASMRALNTESAVESGLPDRFVDYFCVVGHTKKLYPGETRKDLYAIDSPEGLALESKIIDCYPKPETHSDSMEFPEHLSQFVFPDGCYASETQLPPALFTFVLTSSSGHRLYGAALRIYDETMETSQMKEVLEASGYTVPLPWWLNPEAAPPNKNTHRPSDIVFLPKCLVVIGHYPFFHAYRQFLKQLYRISILETPLPIERYIANFVSELPLPPQGKVEVKFGFSTDVHCTISRPAPNELPLARFSYRPLFTTLSISNIMVIVGCLAQETSVALVSKNYGLLTPCAEALLSFLFPLEWQGMYLPIMPYATRDILDAPVPFLVGLNSRYLAETKAKYRPKGVVFVDLDKDTVHLGYNPAGNGGLDFSKALPPSIPDKDAVKLKSKLQEFAGSLYLPPKNGMKGLITNGDGDYLPNTSREPYAHMETLDPASVSSSARNEMLEASECAFPDSKELKPILGFFSEEGQLSKTKKEQTPSERSHEAPSKMSKGLKKFRAKMDRKHTSDHENSTPVRSVDLHDCEEVSERFSVIEIRNGFLRLFTAIFNNYDSYASSDFSGDDLFKAEEFLTEGRRYTPAEREWVLQVLQTQMFQRFLEERIEDPSGPIVLMFDESIVAKNNRSMKKKMKQGKLTTPFLHDESWKISDSFTPPAPSNWGLPADGREYSYSSFPKLDPALVGTVRPRKQWPAEWEQKVQRKGVSRIALRKRRELLSSALQSTMNLSKTQLVPALVAQLPEAKIKNITWGLTTLAELCVNFKVADADVQSKGILARLRKSNRDSELAVIDPESMAKKASGDILFAHDILLASRRKQGILLSRIAKFQVQAKKRLETRVPQHINETPRDEILCAPPETGDNEEPEDIEQDEGHIILIQSRARKHLAQKILQKRVRAVHLVQRTCGSWIQRVKREKRIAATQVQKGCRGFIARRQVKKMIAATQVQKGCRGFIARREVKKMIMQVLRTQAVCRGRKARFAFALVKNEVVKIQAQIRGYLLRTHVQKLLKRQLARYKDQLFLLWARSCSALTFRSQMWSLFKQSFLTYRLLVDELERLWTVLEIKVPRSRSAIALNDSIETHIPINRRSLASEDNIIHDMSNIGFSVKFEEKFVKVAEIVRVAQSQPQKENAKWFPGEASDQICRFSRRLELEKVQVYERLDSLDKTSTVEKIYDSFGFTSKDKKKKVRVLDKIWGDRKNAKASCSAILLLFPELKEGADIVQVKATRKGLSRASVKKSDQALLEPLDKSLWVDRKLDQLYRKSMSEVAIASMGTLPHLSVKLHEASMRKAASFTRRSKARMISQDRWDHWSDYKNAVMRNYLYFEDTPKYL